MKNIKVSVLLISSFLLIALLTAVVGIVSLVGIRTVDDSNDDMYENLTVPMPHLAKAIELLQRQRACMREFIIGSAVGDQSLIEDAYDRVRSYRPVMEVSMDEYFKTIHAPEAIRLFEEARRIYEGDFTDCIEKIHAAAKRGDDPVAMYELMRGYTDQINKVVDNFDVCMAMKIEVAAETAQASSDTADGIFLMVVVIMLLSILIAVVLAIYISGIISKPIIQFTSFMRKAGEHGDISITQADVEVIGTYAKDKNEIGQCIGAAAMFVEHITEISKELELIAEGDLSHEIRTVSEKDVLGNSLAKMSANLNGIFREMRGYSVQVANSAKQVADSAAHIAASASEMSGGAQSLAEGATQQTIQIDELSSSIKVMADQTRANAEMAEKASSIASMVIKKAEKGSNQMDDMTAAVNDISKASKIVSTVMETINNIAAQTNLLSLNAAIEAAHAGDQGAGFAVVAGEVRSLATQSAEAAKETNSVIETSIEKAELGTGIAAEMAASLSEIIAAIKESSQHILEIAKASEEQAANISNINRNVSQVAEIIQQNSALSEESAATSQESAAAAEESAAAAEEMSSQVDTLESLIKRYKLKG